MSQSQAQEIQQLKAQLQLTLDENAKLREIIKQLQAQRFGKKTETMEHLAKGQQELFKPDQYEDHRQDLKRVEKTTVTKVVCHRKGTSHSQRPPRKEFLDSLPQKDNVVELVDHHCPLCHQEMTKVGTKTVSRQIKVTEPQLYCENEIQETYRCPSCDRDGHDLLVSSEVPTPILPHSFFSDSILAQITSYKYQLALPFNRQELIWQARGLPINSKQMAVNLIKVCQTYLEPLYQQLSSAMLKEHVLHMDETPFRVLDAPQLQSWFWGSRTTEEFAQHQIVLFHYANTRSGKVIGQILGPDYSDYLMCDGYGGYSSLMYPSIKFGSCLVHVRRAFSNIVKAEPKTAKASKAFQVLALLRKVFYAENSLHYQTAAEKLHARQVKVKPLMDEFYDYLTEVVRPIGKLRAAIKNAWKLKDRVYRVFENGQLPLTNNPMERCIRPTTLIRKNCLFAKSVAGAKANAVYYSLVETAKLNQLNVYKYFKYLFEHLPNSNLGQLEAYLPWAKEIQAECHN